MKQKLVQRYKYRHGSVWYHESRLASSSWRAALFGVQPSFSSLVLETCLVMELRKSRKKTQTARLTPPLRMLAKTHLLTYLRSKRKCLHSYLYLNAEFSALWAQPFLPNLRIFSFSDEGSVKLLLVLSCRHLSAAAHNTCQTPGP